MKQNTIHDLIMSLSRNEKGYFVKNLPEKDSVYGRLFKIIASQKKYDEEIVKKR